MNASEFGGDALLPFAILGFVMTVGYVVWTWQRAKARRRSENFVPPRRNTLEDELRAELDAVRAEESAADAGTMALDLSPEERERQRRIRELADGGGA